MLRRLLLALALLAVTPACRNTIGGGADTTSGKDVIDLVAQAGSDQPTLLIDGRRAAVPCVHDEIQHGSHVSVDNLLASGGCNSETAVFAANNAMRLVNTKDKWTDLAGDHLSVDMTGLVDVPLVVWVLTLPDVTFAQEQTQVALEVSRATQLYDTMQCGVAFTTAATAIHDATGRRFSLTLPSADCQSKDAFKRVGFDSSGINVYYIDDVNGNQGETCPDGASDIILIGATINDNETLAHELGHAQSLGHSNDVPGIPLDNLMLSPGSNRNSLSLGQCFRTNVNTNSVLNGAHYRSGETRSCPDLPPSPSTPTPKCPDLALHR